MAPDARMTKAGSSQMGHQLLKDIILIARVLASENTRMRVKCLAIFHYCLFYIDIPTVVLKHTNGFHFPGLLYSITPPVPCIQVTPVFFFTVFRALLFRKMPPCHSVHSSVVRDIAHAH